MTEKRPSDLPDYENPPLNEVAFGIQFEPPIEYQQAHITEIWNLFRRDFPKVQENEPLAPTFETFGLPGYAQQGFKIKAGPMHDRFWFLAEDEVELIQFQADRMLHNWRKSQDGANLYPRFESILPKFESESRVLDKYFSDTFSAGMKINQCELSYINRIYLDEENSDISKWLRLGCGAEFGFEDFSVNARKVLISTSGEPYGRLHCLCRSAYDAQKRFLAVLELTVRGAPESTEISSALAFFKEARKAIVYMFDEMTTDFAHSVWGRK